MADSQIADNLIHRGNVGDGLTRITARMPDAKTEMSPTATGKIQKNVLRQRHQDHYRGREA